MPPAKTIKFASIFAGFIITFQFNFSCRSMALSRKYLTRNSVVLFEIFVAGDQQANFIKKKELFTNYVFAGIKVSSLC